MARIFKGMIPYRQNGLITGRETFTVSVHADGSRTYRCLCEMDNFRLLRDITYTIGADFKPLDCFVRVIAEDAFVGSGWFRFTDGFAEGETFTAAEGRSSLRIDTPSHTKLYGSHPLCIDILKCAQAKAERPGEPQPVDNCFSSSLMPETGASGPYLLEKTYDLKYVGPKTVTVKSGTYDCENFQWTTGNGRTLDMFTTPGDYLPVLVEVPERGRRFELWEFEDVKPAVEAIV
jgi:hypothetical protein